MIFGSPLFQICYYFIQYSSNFFSHLDDELSLKSEEYERGPPCKLRGAIGGKTGKTVVLPGFCKIEWGGSGGACRGVIGALSGLGARVAP